MKRPLSLLTLCCLLIGVGAIIRLRSAEVYAQPVSFQHSPLRPTPTPSATHFSPASTALTTTIPAALDSLQIVYRREQQLWHWQQGTARPLRGVAEANNFSLSPDGAWLVVERNDDLWLMRSDGTGERLVVDHAALEPLAPNEPRGRVQLEQWLPDSQQFLFRVASAETNFALGSRLYLFDVADAQWRELMMLNWGTSVLPAPDGAAIALISQAELRLMDLDGGNLRTAFTYTPGAFMHLERPHVRWSADSQSLVTVEPDAGLRVWQIARDGTESILLVEVEPQIAAPYNYSLSPTGHYLVYASIGVSDVAIPSGETYFVDLQTGREWLYYAGVGSFGTWLPEGDRFSFWINREDHLYLGSVQHSLLLPLREVFPLSLVWIDEEYFLYTTGDGDQELRLGSIGSTDIVIDEETWGFTFVR